jgi:putative heme degradation protein
VLASNIDTATPGSVRIALWREWRAMLEDLHAVGPMWSIVRNSQCVLAVQSVYPKLTFSADQLSAGACDGDRSLTYYLPAWKQAVAFDCDCHCGRTHGLEIENMAGEVFHRICLAKGTDLTQFGDWIRMHQATGLEADEIAGGV